MAPQKDPQIRSRKLKKPHLDAEPETLYNVGVLIIAYTSLGIPQYTYIYNIAPNPILIKAPKNRPSNVVRFLLKSVPKERYYT